MLYAHQIITYIKSLCNLHPALVLNMEILSGKQFEKDLKDLELVQLLKPLNSALSQIEYSQNLSQSALSVYKQLITTLLKFSSRPDEEIQLLLSLCLFQVLRLIAPKDIFTKKQVKSLFESTCKATFFLQHPTNPSYQLLNHLLELIISITASALASKHKLYTVLIKFIENCLEFISIGCEIITESLVLDNIRLILEEVSELSDSFLVPILLSVKKEYKKTSRYRISTNLLTTKNSVIRNAFANYIEAVFLQVKSKNINSGILNDKYEIAYKLYKINYEYLINLFSSLPELLQNKKNEKLVKMIGKIAACKKSTLAWAHSHLFSEFLKLFASEQEETRIFMLDFACKYCKNHWNNSQICVGVVEYVTVRLKDTSERIRAHALKALKAMAQYIELPKKTVDEICERVKDVKKKVRKSALEVMFTLYKSKRLSEHLRNDPQKSRYLKIIERIFLFLKSFADFDEQMTIVDFLEELISESYYPEDQANVVLTIFEDLSEESRKTFGNIFVFKAFWAKHLEKTLESEDADSLSIFCGNLKLGIFNCKIKSSLKSSTGEIFEILSNEETRILIKKILVTQNYTEKKDLIRTLKEHLNTNQSGYLQLKSKCLYTLIRQEHIPYYLNKIEILPIIAKSFPQFIESHLSDIVLQLDKSEKQAEILLTLSVFDIKKYDWEEKIEEKLLVLSEIGPYSGAQSGRKLIKNMKLSFIEQLATTLIDIASTQELIIIQLLFLKQIVKYWPTVTEKLKQDLKNLAYLVCENPDLQIEAKCQGIILLHSLIKYCGFYRQAIFVYIRKIGFNLESFYKKKVKKDSELTNNEEFTFRVRCFKSLLGLLNISEMKSMLNCKTLTCLAYAALSPMYSNTICDLIQKNIYDKFNIPPPLLSVLALQLASSDSRPVKDALLQVFQRMKKNSIERSEQGQGGMAQPEIYLPYILYIISKCRVSEKSYKVVLMNYVKCLFSCDGIDVNYLMYLLRQLRKFSIEGKNVKCDVWTAPSKHLELEKLCDEVTLIISQNYLPDMFQEVQCKVLIPSEFFVKKIGVTSPDQVKYGVDEKGSEVRKRGRDTTPGKKEFNMFNNQSSSYL